MTDLRKPSDDEQRLIVDVSDAIRRLEGDRRVRVAAVGMTRGTIEDSDGRWSFILGRPVLEISTGEHGEIVLIVPVARAEPEKI